MLYLIQETFSLKRYSAMKYAPLNKKAQNIIEYVVLFTAVVVVLILFLNNGGGYSTATNKVLKQPIDMLDQAISKDF